LIASNIKILIEKKNGENSVVSTNKEPFCYQQYGMLLDKLPTLDGYDEYIYELH
jgi:hypothetical protein